ncbi:class I SAM-dependent methyltransferase [bacterium]|nr:class I SAM-dependent methyltransferase [bacterium]
MSDAIANPLIESVAADQEFWEARAKMAPFSSGYTDPSVEQLEWNAIQRAIRTYAAGHSDPSVLEIGCHVGYTTKKLHELMQPSHYDALDISPGSVEMARHYSERHGYREVNFLTASATAIPLEEAACDLLFSIRCIQNIQSADGQADAFAEASRLLKPGGLAVLVENREEELGRLNRLREAADLDPIGQPRHTRFLVWSELSEQVSRDFEVVETNFFASAYYFGTRFAKWLNPAEEATELNSPHNLFYREMIQGSFRLALGPALIVLRKRANKGVR